MEKSSNRRWKHDAGLCERGLQRADTGAKRVKEGMKGKKNFQKMKTFFPFLSIYPKELETESQRDICISMFTEALFTIAKKWKQPKCPLMDGWIRKMWCIHTEGYYLDFEKKNLVTCSTDIKQGPLGYLGTKTFCVPHFFDYTKQPSFSLHNLP